MIGTMLILSMFIHGQWIPVEPPKPMPSAIACVSAAAQWLSEHEDDALKPDTPTISAECIVGTILPGNPL